MAYIAQGVNFDGTNDDLQRGGGLTGGADSKLWTGSFWFNRRGDTGLSTIYRAISNERRFLFNSSNVLVIAGENTGGSDTLNITGGAFTDSLWHHVMFAVNMANASQRFLYVDGVDALTVVTYTDADIDGIASDWFLGQNSVGGARYSGDLADVWDGFGQYVDLSQASNRLKFYGASGGAVDLGSDGSTPTGVAPIVYFTGATATWHVNAGTGGGFTENGAITDAADNPPSEPDASRLALLGVG